MSSMSTTGIGTVQARIAEIQARLRSMAPGVAAPGGVVGHATGVAGPFEDMVEQAGATRAPAPDAPGAAVRTLAGASGTAPSGGATGGWVARLPEQGRAWAGAIEDAATRHGVDPALFAALVWTESGFRPDAVSHAGARGLAQLMPATAAGMGVDPDDPVQNLDGGARFLRAMLDRFGSVELGLAAYNAGPGRVAQAGGIPRIPETQAYVPGVLRHHAELQGSTT